MYTHLCAIFFTGSCIRYLLPWLIGSAVKIMCSGNEPVYSLVNPKMQSREANKCMFQLCTSTGTKVFFILEFNPNKLVINFYMYTLEVYFLFT